MDFLSGIPKICKKLTQFNEYSLNYQKSRKITYYMFLLIPQLLLASNRLDQKFLYQDFLLQQLLCYFIFFRKLFHQLIIFSQIKLCTLLSIQNLIIKCQLNFLCFLYLSVRIMKTCNQPFLEQMFQQIYSKQPHLQISETNQQSYLYQINIIKIPIFSLQNYFLRFQCLLLLYQIILFQTFLIIYLTFRIQISLFSKQNFCHSSLGNTDNDIISIYLLRGIYLRQSMLLLGDIPSFFIYYSQLSVIKSSSKLVTNLYQNHLFIFIQQIQSYHSIYFSPIYLLRHLLTLFRNVYQLILLYIIIWINNQNQRLNI
ncbi:transmembrane protein, putative (macronuclear) [Tetrahymena thermophila SB210]|uniref:Transmembrane protein, putative n=1 Tax=Tetrahymena thermophila (strain SB210) TaxID=312017 RepID=W7X6W9_TETTS|nr:transmembrane protein, putative [Tetrahymena thermophila SB210]EWS73112.1 transmembrane protein, putative [Tetrahymena thermophila SB210]|eukprot:XP_012654361.1 transmembrane protein, putative [Tetrahymena thermophila SB210]